jgi:outer membrane lipoprotein SlyB
MNSRQFRLWAGLAGAALFVSAQAQDYRYQNSGDPPRQTIQQQPQGQPVQQYQQPLQPYQQQSGALCNYCGTVDAVRTFEKPGEASGAGMVAGGLIGGLIGHQVGQGRGNTAATIVGAAGGAYAGHQVERNTRKVIQYDVAVRMDDGTSRSIVYDVEPGFRAGDRVRFVDGRLIRY